jgi:hypothetical protein
MTYEEFELEYKKHHTCGIPFIPTYLAYDSYCPRCEPDSEAWKIDCRAAYDAGKTVYTNGGWSSE